MNTFGSEQQPEEPNPKPPIDNQPDDLSAGEFTHRPTHTPASAEQDFNSPYIDERSSDESFGSAAKATTDNVVAFTAETLSTLADKVKLRHPPGWDELPSVPQLIQECLRNGPDSVLNNSLLSAQAKVGTDKLSLGLQHIANDGLALLLPATVSDCMIRDGKHLLRDRNAEAVKRYFAEVQEAADLDDNVTIAPEKLKLVVFITDHTSKTSEELSDNSNVLKGWYRHHFDNREFKGNGSAALLYLNDPKMQEWIKDTLPGWEGKAGKGIAMLIGKLYLIAKDIQRVGYFDSEVYSLAKQPSFLPALNYSLLEQRPTNFVKATQIRVQPESEIGNMNLTFGRVNNLVAQPIVVALTAQLEEHLGKQQHCTREQLAMFLALKTVSNQVPTLLSGEGSVRLFNPTEVEEARKKGVEWPAAYQGLDWSVEIVDLMSWTYYEIAKRIPEDLKTLTAEDIDALNLRLGVAVTSPLEYQHKHSPLKALAATAGEALQAGRKEAVSPLKNLLAKRHNDQHTDSPDAITQDGMAPQVIKGFLNIVTQHFGPLDFVNAKQLHDDWYYVARECYIDPIVAAQPQPINKLESSSKQVVHEDILEGQLARFQRQLNPQQLSDCLRSAKDTEPARYDYSHFLDPDNETAKESLQRLVKIVESGIESERLVGFRKD